MILTPFFFQWCLNMPQQVALCSIFITLNSDNHESCWAVKDGEFNIHTGCLRNESVEARDSNHSEVLVLLYHI